MNRNLPRECMDLGDRWGVMLTVVGDLYDATEVVYGRPGASWSLEPLDSWNDGTGVGGDSVALDHPFCALTLAQKKVLGSDAYSDTAHGSAQSGQFGLFVYHMRGGTFFGVSEIIAGKTLDITTLPTGYGPHLLTMADRHAWKRFRFTWEQRQKAFDAVCAAMALPGNTREYPAPVKEREPGFLPPSHPVWGAQPAPWATA